MGSRDDELYELCNEIAVGIGRASQRAWAEHDRWDLYRLAASDEPVRSLLFRACAAETVPIMASALVIELFDHVDRQERLSLVAVLPESVQDFPARRIRELDVLEALAPASGEAVSVTAHDIEEWSDWLQRRVIESTVRGDLLELLARHGRTKKLRRLASGKLEE